MERVFGWKGEEKRKVVGFSHFLSRPTTIQSLQNGKKIGEKRSMLDKIALLPPMANFLSFSTFLSFPFFFFFCPDKISSGLHDWFTLVMILVFFFYLDKISHSKPCFFLFFLFVFFFNILLAFAYFINK